MAGPRFHISPAPLLAGLLLLGRGTPAVADPCPPGAQLEGAPELVAAIGAALGQRGVSAVVPASCPTVRAQVGWHGTRVAVIVTRAPGESDTREVKDIDLAATFIESWARHDISDPLLAVRSLGPLPPSPPPPPAPPEPRTVIKVIERGPRFSVAARGEVAVAIDRSVWAGASLSGCVAVSRACLGVLLRAAGDAYLSNLDQAVVGRLDTSLLLAADFPFQLGRLSLAPGLGLGVGWMHVRLDPGLQIGDGVDFGGLRAALGLRAAVALKWGLAVDFSLSLEAAFLSSGSVSLVPTPLPLPPQMPPRIEVAGPPWGLLRAGIGLRWSSPWR